jgi:hypothetical protein
MARVLNKCFGCITLVQFKKSKTMKYFIALLLLSGSMYCQEQVFNVQRYCVDEVPLRLENAIFQEMNIRLCSSTEKE